MASSPAHCSLFHVFQSHSPYLSPRTSSSPDSVSLLFFSHFVSCRVFRSSHISLRNTCIGSKSNVFPITARFFCSASSNRNFANSAEEKSSEEGNGGDVERRPASGVSAGSRFSTETISLGIKEPVYEVVLAANDLPSINDVTYSELLEIISKLKDENGHLCGVDTSGLLIANSGNDLPVIDLTSVAQELAYLASDADLVILEGMGRGIETNLYAQLKCDSVKIGMVKHPEVAQFLGGRLYDCVFKYNEVI